MSRSDGAITSAAAQRPRRPLLELLCPACGSATAWVEPLACGDCGRSFDSAGGVVDLVIDPGRDSERSHYDAEYASGATAVAGRVDVSSLAAVWSDPRAPVLRIVWQRLGPLRAKRVLLLGNGRSRKELYFLTQGVELLVVSDLSGEGLRELRGAVETDRFADRLAFAAIDALALPFEDESFDLVYAYDCVHHFPELDRFLGEAYRVLRPGGRAVFRDDAFVPAWQMAKRTALRPFVALSHRRYEISPEDHRASIQGGFRESELARIVAGLGGQPWFRRTGLVYHLWRRGGSRLLPRPAHGLLASHAIARKLIELDRWIERRPRLRANLMLLVWGFCKTRPARQLMQA